MKLTKEARSLLLKLLIVSAICGTLIPFLMIILFGLLAGMVMYIYLFFPAVCAITGALAGRQVRWLWFFPVVNGVFSFYWVLWSSGYQVGVTVHFVFLYILLGAIAMGLCACFSWLVKQRKKEK